MSVSRSILSIEGGEITHNNPLRAGQCHKPLLTVRLFVCNTAPGIALKGLRFENSLPFSGRAHNLE